MFNETLIKFLEPEVNLRKVFACPKVPAATEKLNVKMEMTSSTVELAKPTSFSYGPEKNRIKFNDIRNCYLIC